MPGRSIEQFREQLDRATAALRELASEAEDAARGIGRRGAPGEAGGVGRGAAAGRGAGALGALGRFMPQVGAAAAVAQVGDRAARAVMAGQGLAGARNAFDAQMNDWMASVPIVGELTGARRTRDVRDAVAGRVGAFTGGLAAVGIDVPEDHRRAMIERAVEEERRRHNELREVGAIVNEFGIADDETAATGQAALHRALSQGPARTIYEDIQAGDPARTLKELLGAAQELGRQIGGGQQR